MYSILPARNEAVQQKSILSSWSWAQKQWLEDVEVAVTWRCCQKFSVWQLRITRAKCSSMPLSSIWVTFAPLKIAEMHVLFFYLFQFITFSKEMGYILFSTLTYYAFYDMISAINGYAGFDSDLIWFTQVIYMAMVQHLNDGSDRKCVPHGQTWSIWCMEVKI